MTKPTSTYFATFPAGTFPIIFKHLKSFAPTQLRVLEHDDSAVVFESALTPERLIEIRYFTNVYIVADNHMPRWMLKGKYFNLAYIKNGEPQSLSGADRIKLESKLKHDFGLTPNTRLAKNNFYQIERQSGRAVLTLRLARAKFKREVVAAGELRPELAHILCLAAGVKAKHVVLDPFAGYGSIPLEAVRGFGCKQVIAADNRTLPGRHEQTSIKWHVADVANLEFLAKRSVDHIVTDPPWGNYNKSDNLTDLYTNLSNEASRILKPYGTAVVLSGYADAEQCLLAGQGMRLVDKWDVLVSGKKATIYKLQKRS